MVIRFRSPGKISRWLCVFVAFFVLAGIGMELILAYHVEFFGCYKLTHWFSLGAERSFPAWFSSGLLLLAGMLLGLIAVQKRRGGHPFALRWALLSVVFVALSLDEAVGLHENLCRVASGGRAKGFLAFWWVVPAGMLLVPFGLLYVRFLMRLPRRTLVLFLLSAGLYVGGAMGLEMVSAKFYSVSGQRDTFGYLSAMILEESMEMFGVVLFCHALLGYMGRHMAACELDIGRRDFLVDKTTAPGPQARRSGRTHRPRRRPAPGPVTESTSSVGQKNT